MGDFETFSVPEGARSSYHMVDISHYDWKSFEENCNYFGVQLVRLGDKALLDNTEIDPNTIYFFISGMLREAYGFKLGQVLHNTTLKSIPKPTEPPSGTETAKKVEVPIY